ncbi:hypothetical protein C1H46_009598 [Malus baccata]|uniref:Uncharacterized protein n=1 Tax=Malus baccata TaxID=106549 RepID=A0A540N153_MALBA|nr:hypothetical protein C1H46_009598 [Malus baccata]
MSSLPRESKTSCKIRTALCRCEITERIRICATVAAAVEGTLSLHITVPSLSSFAPSGSTPATYARPSPLLVDDLICGECNDVIVISTF